jgi:hypothetical protein
VWLADVLWYGQGFLSMLSNTPWPRGAARGPLRAGSTARGCENISRAELISLVNLQVPRVLHVDASVFRSIGVMFIMFLDLFRAS